jgi:hypothetical protein
LSVIPNKYSRRRVATAVAAAALALTGAGAGGAQAAQFSPAGASIVQTGNITLTHGTGPDNTYSCPNWKFTGSSVFSGSDQVQQCTRVSTGYAGTFTSWPWETPMISGSSTSVRFQSPWGRTWLTMAGYYNQTMAFYDVPFVNGSGSTPSRLIYNNVNIGSGFTMTGTLEVKTSTGGLVTIVP